ncbi:MAG TPA: hypothetical protein VFW94_14280 [Candidatus Acidoferrales bacterium]|nr:hypothetical protein [Candidatus Acidoferrales bacterium]
MSRDHSIAGCKALCAAIALLWISGCATALAPGYTVLNETRTVEFVPGPPGSHGSLHIGERYRLKNTGTTTLPFLDVTFPEEKAFGTHDVRVEWNGHAVDLKELPEEYRQESPNTRRISFEPPWMKQRTGALGIEYAFSPGIGADNRVAIGDQTFHLSSLGWAALPQPPRHLLSPYPVRPPKMTYSVRVPKDFLVLARGKLKHRKMGQNEADYEFQLGGNDLAPFVVAGRYVETRVGGGSVVFWTLHPLGESAGSSPERIAEAWATLEKDFGPIDTEVHVPHIVEAPMLDSDITEGPDKAVASFPGGALVGEQTLALGIASDAFVERVSHALAHNWFSDEMYPSPNAAIGIGEGLAEYATVAIDEAEGGAEAKRKRIEYFLRRYGDAQKGAKETPLGVTRLTDPPGQRAISLAKAPLMYVALEDTCGEQPVRNALKRLVRILSGQQVGFNDLRSAMEQTCGKDLGEFFRVWLYGKGLPSSFAARYKSSAAP